MDQTVMGKRGTGSLTRRHKSWNAAGMKGIMEFLLHVSAMYVAFWIKKQGILSFLLKGGYGTREIVRQFPFSLLPSMAAFGYAIILRTFGLSDRPEDRLASFFFSSAMLIGHCYESIGTFTGILVHGSTALAGGVFLYGFYISFRMAFSIIRAGVGKIQDIHWERILPERISGLADEHLTDGHFYRRAWLVMAVCWLPYIVFRYPAGVEFDAHYQIKQFLGYEVMSAHHPPLSTALMGTFVKLGGFFGSKEAGLCGFVVFQACVCISVLAYSLVFMKRMGLKNVWLLMVLANYSIVPLYAAFFTSAIKDALYSIMVLLSVILAAEEVLFGRARPILMVLAAVLVCLLRKNGVYVMGIWFLTSLLMGRKVRCRCLAAASGAACVLFVLYSSVLLPGLGLRNDDVQEGLSIPFQQTARYLKEHQDDVTQEELEAIGKVLDVDTIAEKYYPLLSDPVKGTYHGESSALPGYFHAWLRQFLRHPLTYFDAALNQCYGFFCPDAVREGDSPLGFYKGTSSDEKLTFYEPAILEPFAMALAALCVIMAWFPFTGMFYNVGIQLWVTVWVVLHAAVKKRWNALILSVPSVAGMLVCVASPTWFRNGYRYAMPVVCTVPLLLAVALRGSSHCSCMPDGHAEN